MIKLDQKEIEKIVFYYPIEAIQILQTVVCVMIGGGILGRLGAEQPAKFYIDDRVGRLPYPKKEIYQAMATLATFARAKGLDPQKLREMPVFHNCGIF